MFEQSVDRFGGAVRGAGVVEEREDVIAAPFHRLPERAELVEAGGNPGLDGVDHPSHDLLPLGWVGGLVGVDHVLVDAPGDLERDMPLVGEDLREPVLLLLCEQRSAGAGDASDAVERVTGAAPMPQCLLLDALPAAVELVTDQGHDMIRIHYGGDGVDGFDGGALVAGESVHRDDLHSVPKRVGLGFEPGLERLLRAALDHGQQA